MIKSFVCLLILLNAFTLTPIALKANEGKAIDSLKTTQSIDSTSSRELITRLEEIKEMDISAMSRLEKRELRTEVRSTKKELKKNDRMVRM